MRLHLLVLPLALLAGPAFAQTAPAPRQQPTVVEDMRVPSELTDPAMADKLARIMQALGKVFLDLPIGEVEAAIEGRPVTAADKRRTVRTAGREGDPDFERDFERQIANSKPMIEASQKALATALPAMMKGMAEAAKALERATANLPDPTYPKR